MIQIHTIINNNHDTSIIKTYLNIRFWNINDIINDYMTSCEKEYINKLVLYKSKHDYCKYILMKNNSGLFVNYDILRYNIFKIGILFKILDKNDKIKYYFFKQQTINDDIFYIKNIHSDLIIEILKNIQFNKIPTNMLEHSEYIGQEYFDEIITLYQNDDIEYNNSLEINCNNVYDNVYDLMEPTKFIDKYFKFHDTIINLTELISFILLKILYYSSIHWLYTVIIVICKVAIVYFLSNQIKQEINLVKIYDNRIFFDPKDFTIFNELIKNTQIIKNEVIQLLNLPYLNIKREIDDWYSSDEYVDSIKNKLGWIKSWNNSNKNDNGWYNYGLYYFGKEFDENISKCPETCKILSKFKDKINICGFSLIKGPHVIEEHSDITGLSSNSLAFHLGIIIPENNKTCKLVVYDNIKNNYMYVLEKEAHAIVFDATHKHYAYNQSIHDRVILYIDFKINN